MAASVKLWVDTTTPSINAVDLNGFKLENNNLIVATGQTLNITDRNQTTQAVARYVGAGDFFTAVGINTIALSPTGTLIAPSVLLPGQRVRFFAAATNTGATTINLNFIGAVTLLDQQGVALTGGELVINRVVEAQYNGASYLLTSFNNTNQFDIVATNFGTAAAPSHTFQGALNRGMYATDVGGEQIRFSVEGGDQLILHTDQFFVTSGTSGITQLSIDSISNITTLRSDAAAGAVLELNATAMTVDFNAVEALSITTTTFDMALAGNTIMTIDGTINATVIQGGVSSISMGVLGTEIAANAGATTIAVNLTNTTVFTNDSIETATATSILWDFKVAAEFDANVQYNSTARFADGTTPAPSIAFKNGTNSGFKLDAGVGVIVSGVQAGAFQKRTVGSSNPGSTTDFDAYWNTSLIGQQVAMGIISTGFTGVATNIACPVIGSNPYNISCVRTGLGLYDLTHTFNNSDYKILMTVSVNNQAGVNDNLTVRFGALTTTQVTGISFTDELDNQKDPEAFHIVFFRNAGNII